ncbi:EpsG family protein [uncultured Bacteroides sp.]|uniref:EpsG family protein n=1 Tax=uncultured Bacteroides sp. TaxID=162156 RepID=UPI002AAC0678|nr:EpsG family protein [uncultured Bacteroides sp.]
MYIFTDLLLLLFTFLNHFSKNRKLISLCFFIAFIWLLFHDGFRWETGTDWLSYYPHFMHCLDNATMPELAYQKLCELIRSISSNYSIFLIIHASIIYLLFFDSISRYSCNKFLSLFLFYCMMLPYLGMNRQYISLAIIVFSFKFIIDRKRFYAIVLFIIALLFHYSVIICIPILFLNIKLNNRFYIYAFIFAMIINQMKVFNSIPSSMFLFLGDDIAKKAYEYMSLTDYAGNISILFYLLGISKRLIFVAIIMKYRKVLESKTPYFNLFLNLYFIGVVFYILFYNSIFQILVSRGLLYYNIVEIFLFPLLVSCFAGKYNKILYITLIVMYGITNQIKGLDSYVRPGYDDCFRPYKGLFINTNVKRTMN